MRLPDFLIIGAMKSGTTTLFFDLAKHPNIFLPNEKEPHDLCSDQVLNRRGMKRYASLFRKAKTDQICGEASTGYTKLPTYTDVPERAVQVLGANTKLIYIVRDPIVRSLSHHRFMYQQGKMPASFLMALKHCPEIVDYSKYAYQIEAWQQVFSPKNIKVIIFEQYINNRPTELQSVMRFLQLPIIETPLTPPKNVTEQIAVPTWPIDRFINTPIYRRGIKNFFPQPWRDWTKNKLFQKTTKRPVAVETESRALLEALLTDDIQRFSNLFPYLDLSLWGLSANL